MSARLAILMSEVPSTEFLIYTTGATWNASTSRSSAAASSASPRRSRSPGAAGRSACSSGIRARGSTRARTTAASFTPASTIRPARSKREALRRRRPPALRVLRRARRAARALRQADRRARREAEIAALDALRQRGEANGVEGLALVDRAFIARREPAVAAAAALFSPNTGIVDAEALVKALVRAGEAAGVVFLAGTTLAGADRDPAGVVLHTAREAIGARAVVNAAGLYADEVSGCWAASAFASIRAAASTRSWRRRSAASSTALVYPLPHASGHGLGVHLTRSTGGQRVDRPDDSLSGSEGRLRRRDREPLEAFVEPTRELLPDVTLADLRLSGSGIRAKLHPPTESFADFLIRRDRENPAVIQAAGIDSPGLTACLAIGARDHPGQKPEPQAPAGRAEGRGDTGGMVIPLQIFCSLWRGGGHEPFSCARPSCTLPRSTHAPRDWARCVDATWHQRHLLWPNFCAGPPAARQVALAAASVLGSLSRTPAQTRNAPPISSTPADAGAAPSPIAWSRPLRSETAPALRPRTSKTSGASRRRGCFSKADDVSRERVLPRRHRHAGRPQLLVRERAVQRPRRAQRHLRRAHRNEPLVDVVQAELPRQLARELEPRAPARIHAVIQPRRHPYIVTAAAGAFNDLPRRTCGIDDVGRRHRPILEDAGLPPDASAFLIVSTLPVAGPAPGGRPKRLSTRRTKARGASNANHSPRSFDTAYTQRGFGRSSSV